MFEGMSLMGEICQRGINRKTESERGVVKVLQDNHPQDLWLHILDSFPNKEQKFCTGSLTTWPINWVHCSGFDVLLLMAAIINQQGLNDKALWAQWGRRRHIHLSNFWTFNGLCPGEVPTATRQELRWFVQTTSALWLSTKLKFGAPTQSEEGLAKVKLFMCLSDEENSGWSCLLEAATVKTNFQAWLWI